MIAKAAAALLALAAVSGAAANPLARQAAQLSCSQVAQDAPYFEINPTQSNNVGSSKVGFTNYTLQEALKDNNQNFSAEDNPQVLSIQGGGPFGGQSFAFWACASSYMGYPANTTDSNGVQKWYGLLSPQNIALAAPSSPVNCTTLRSFSTDDNKPILDLLVNEPCQLTDGNGLENQYYELTEVNDIPYTSAIFNLTFLGHPKSASGPDFYFGLPTDNSTTAVKVQRDQDTGYQPVLEYVHIN